MSVPEADRHQLFTRVEEVLGAEAAVTMMSLLPPVGWADVATTHDVLALERRLDQLDLRFDRLEAELRSTERSFVTWLLASQATLAAVVVGAAGVVVALG